MLITWQSGHVMFDISVICERPETSNSSLNPQGACLEIRAQAFERRQLNAFTSAHADTSPVTHEGPRDQLSTWKPHARVFRHVNRKANRDWRARHNGRP
ncbi:unnamed protein product [Lampetra fluviatilis]